MTIRISGRAGCESFGCGVMPRTGVWRTTLLSLIVPVAFWMAPQTVRAADGYWLDQYNALVFLGLFRLDPELQAMREQGAAVVMVHADSLPDPLLHWIAWRARRAGPRGACNSAACGQRRERRERRGKKSRRGSQPAHGRRGGGVRRWVG